MPVEKYYLEENFEESIDFYGTNQNQICIRFCQHKQSKFSIDLDIETLEEFIIDLNFEIQRIKLKIENEEGGEDA